jgi:hypothetical protein
LGDNTFSGQPVQNLAYSDRIACHNRYFESFFFPDAVVVVSGGGIAQSLFHHPLCKRFNGAYHIFFVHGSDLPDQ